LTPHIAVVLGLGFGDEGKGSLVDWLVRRHAPAGGAIVVRHGGGAQAAHHVTTPEGRTHCFSQLGSGSLIPKTRTYLGREMVIDPLALHLEAAAIAQAGVKNALSLLAIHPDALVVTPWHARLNRLRETLRLGDRHGSTGRGIGEAQLDAERGLPTLRMGHVRDHDALVSQAQLVRATKLEHADLLIAEAEAASNPAIIDARRLRDELAAQPLDTLVHALEAIFAPGRAELRADLPLHNGCSLVVFEGAQGILLDRDHGFFPHVSPTRATRPAAELAIESLGFKSQDAEFWGVLRAYHTRHGAGPLPSALPNWASLLPETTNGQSPWQGQFRCGPFDAVLARYALARVGALHHLAVNCVDRVERLDDPMVCEAWEVDGARLDNLPNGSVPPEVRTALAMAASPIQRRINSADLITTLEQLVGRPIDLVGRGPRALDKRSP
jgi:adenylosuccinate synthase